jgi:hypothetical protein
MLNVVMLSVVVLYVVAPRKLCQEQLKFLQL